MFNSLSLRAIIAAHKSVIHTSIVVHYGIKDRLVDAASVFLDLVAANACGLGVRE